MTKPAEAVPLRLRAARQLAKITTAAMGKACCVDATTITAYEREKHGQSIPLSSVAVYVRETEGSLEYFYGEGPDLPKPRVRRSKW